MYSRLVLQHLLISSCVHQFHANWYTYTGKLHARVPGWLGSYYWIWYAPRIYDASFAGQPSILASQPMNQQVNVSAPQPTQPQDATPASQPSVTLASAPSPASPNNVSVPWLTPQQQNLAMMIQPKSPTEVLANRIPHANGVT